ncbi:uncharacterized protein LOC142240460 [Haematobia irritans]|uniref:uncharacterized protein LOC142240460 n=1 Tax=Haematobia irritans TaxID=7368 RepID=UPI003F50330B
MCNTSLHQRNFNNLMEPFSFSTLHFLRTRNRLMLPPNAEPSPYYNLLKDNAQMNPQLNTILHHNYETAKTPPTSPILDVMDNSTLEQIPTEMDNTVGCFSHTESGSEKSLNISKAKDSIADDTDLLQTVTPAALTLPNINILPLPGSSANLLSSTTQPSLPAFEYLTPAARNLSPVDFPLMELNRVGSVFPSFLHRRPRGEKRPIPEEQKDDKYYERRKRNNEAAKKSRDARKIREDRIAFRAAFLEQENSLLRAQVLALRDELQTMRQILSRNSHNQTSIPGVRSAGLI